MTRNQELREEAKKRGYTHDNFKCLKDLKSSGNPNLDKWYYEGCTDTLYSNSCGNGGKVVYKDGVWAEIIKPMETFTPITMRCTQEQFETIKPKLDKKKSLNIFAFNKKWNSFYLALFEDGRITNGLIHSSATEIHEEWNEEIFLKACGIKTETLQQQLEKAEAEVQRLKEAIEEENKIKVGDWAYIDSTKCFFKVRDNDFNFLDSRHRRITNQELIKLLEQEIK